jgi:ribosome modulation factor
MSLEEAVRENRTKKAKLLAAHERGEHKGQNYIFCEKCPYSQAQAVDVRPLGEPDADARERERALLDSILSGSSPTETQKGGNTMTATATDSKATATESTEAAKPAAPSAADAKAAKELVEKALEAKEENRKTLAAKLGWSRAKLDRVRGGTLRESELAHLREVLSPKS